MLHRKASSTNEQPVRLYRPTDFVHEPHNHRCLCPAGHVLHSNGSKCTINARQCHKFIGSLATCGACEQRERGRRLYCQRIGTVEPVFGNLRGKAKANTQRKLYCWVHNIEKLAHQGYQ